MSSVLLGASSSSRLSKGIQQRKNIKMPKVVQQVFESSDEDGTMERAPTASSNQPQPAAAAAPGSGSRKPRSLHPHAPPAAVDAPAAASSSSSKKRKRFVAPATPSKYSSYELFGTDSEDEDNIHDRVRKTDEPAEKKVKKHSSSPSSSLCTSGGCEPQKTKTKCTNDYVSSAGPSSSFSSRSVKRTSARDVFGADSDDDDDDHIEAKAGKKPSPIVSHFTKRNPNGITRRTYSEKEGSHYIELKVYNCREIEKVQPMNRWRHAIITVKNKTNADSEAWAHLTNFIAATRQEFKNCRPELINGYGYS